MSSDSDRRRYSAKQHIPMGADFDRDGPAWQGPSVESVIGTSADERVLSTRNDEAGEWMSSVDYVELERWV